MTTATDHTFTFTITRTPDQIEKLNMNEEEVVKCFDNTFNHFECTIGLNILEDVLDLIIY